MMISAEAEVACGNDVVVALMVTAMMMKDASMGCVEGDGNCVCR